MTLDDFKAFLQMHNAIDEYAQCIKHRRGKDMTIEIAWAKHRHIDIIDSTLTWSHTPSGQKFWQHLHHLWKIAYNSGKPIIAKGCRSIW